MKGSLCAVLHGRGVWDQNTGLPMNLLMDAAYGRISEQRQQKIKRKGGRPEEPRMRRSSSQSSTQMRTSISDLLCKTQHMWTGLSLEKLYRTKAGCSLLDFKWSWTNDGLIKKKEIFDKVYKPFVKDLFRIILHRFSPRFSMSEIARGLITLCSK